MVFSLINSTSLFFVYPIIAVCVRPAWQGRRPAADNPFPSIAHQSLLRWPPSSLTLMPHRIFLWRYAEDSVFLPPLPHDLPKLRRRIFAAIWEIDLYMLQQVWAEMDYRLDVRHVTKGGHIEHLWGMQKKTWKIPLPSVGCMLQSFPSFKCIDVMKCVRELWITLYYASHIKEDMGGVGSMHRRGRE